MILDTLSQCERYLRLHPAFLRAFEFLGRPDLALLGPGRHTVDGDRLYVSIDHKEGRGREGARLESHRRYIDIQFTIEGNEEIGWLPVAGCDLPNGAFDEDRAIRFYEDRPRTWVSVPPGQFAIFFPDDAHAPLGGHGLLKKAIAKIAITGLREASASPDSP
jgi:biofilm protein TabA